MPTEQTKTECLAAVASSDLLADLFAASAELRFHIKSLNLARVEQNQSWHRHTEVMRRVESALRSANAKPSDSAGEKL